MERSHPSLPILPDDVAADEFGYQPWVLAAGAIGFVAAGQVEGGLAPSIGALIGIGVCILGLLLIGFLRQESVATERSLEDFSFLALDSPLLVLESSKSRDGMVPPEVDRKSLPGEDVEGLLREMRQRLYLRYLLTLLTKTRLSAPEKILLLRELTRSGSQ